MSVLENLVMPSTPTTSRRGFLNSPVESRITDEFIEKLSIQTPSKWQFIGNLSGGNQQKVILARWLNISPKILIIDEPTRGIDVGARSEIHKLLRRYAEDGVGIIMISSEMEEVLSISDRIVVLRDGRVAASLDSEQATQETIVSYALGVTK
jgi:ABC-type sugar transport system ATPase subunit